MARRVCGVGSLWSRHAAAGLFCSVWAGCGSVGIQVRQSVLVGSWFAVLLALVLVLFWPSRALRRVIAANGITRALAAAGPPLALAGIPAAVC